MARYSLLGRRRKEREDSDAANGSPALSVQTAAAKYFTVQKGNSLWNGSSSLVLYFGSMVTERPDIGHYRKASVLPWARKLEITCFLPQVSAETFLDWPVSRRSGCGELVPREWKHSVGKSHATKGSFFS